MPRRRTVPLHASLQTVQGKTSGLWVVRFKKGGETPTGILEGVLTGRGHYCSHGRIEPFTSEISNENEPPSDSTRLRSNIVGAP